MDMGDSGRTHEDMQEMSNADDETPKTRLTISELEDKLKRSYQSKSHTDYAKRLRDITDLEDPHASKPSEPYYSNEYTYIISEDNLEPLPPSTASNNSHPSTKINTIISRNTFPYPSSSSKSESIFTFASASIRKYIPYLTGMHHESLKELHELLYDAPISPYTRQFVQWDLEREYMTMQNLGLVHNTIVVSIIAILGICFVIVNALNPGTSYFVKAFPTSFSAVGIMICLIVVVWRSPKEFLAKYQNIVSAFAVTLAASTMMAGWDAIYYRHYGGTFLTYITSRKLKLRIMSSPFRLIRVYLYGIIQHGYLFYTGLEHFILAVYYRYSQR
jgi:hypothetical protein